MSKIATIRDFAGMEESGLFYVENLIPKKVGGKSVLTPGYGNYYVGSETNLASFGLPESIAVYDFGGTLDALSRDSSGGIFKIDLLNFSSAPYKVHAVAQSGIISQLGLGDLFLTKNNNLLYPTAGTLGIAYIGTCHADSTSTKIVDEDGRNFGTLGISTSTGYNKVYNVTKGEEFTITSITNENATNDALNFSAGSATPEEGDYFIVFADGGKDNSGNKWNFFSTTAYPHYVGQEANTSFYRQIRQFDTDYLILNGNFVAALNEDETTWNDNFKQLPTKTQAKCFEINQDRILIGCEYQGKGRLLLWDGFNDGFLSIVETERPITSISTYDTGFIFTMGNSVFLTNGYSIKKITELPDTTIQSNIVTKFNQLKVIDDNIFILASGNDATRTPAGMYVYKIGVGWINLPFANASTTQSLSSNSLGGIFSLDDSGIYRLFSSFANAQATNAIVLNRTSFTTSKTGSVIFRLPLPDITNIKKIDLHLSPSSQLDSLNTNNTVVTVNVGDGKGFLYSYVEANTGSTTTSIINKSGASAGRSASVGQEIVVLEGDAGGNRSYITAIANQGASNETWTVSPALSAAPTNNTLIRFLKLRQANSKTVNPNSITDVLTFDVAGINTDDLLIEVVLKGASNGDACVDIIGIDIYA